MNKKQLRGAAGGHARAKSIAKKKLDALGKKIDALGKQLGVLTRAFHKERQNFIEEIRQNHVLRGENAELRSQRDRVRSIVT